MGQDIKNSLNVKQLTIGGIANASLPAAADGTLMIDTTNNKLMVRLNGGWETVTSA